MTEAATLRFAMPTDARQLSLEQAIFACFAVLGEDLRTHLRHTLTEHFGRDWAQVLRRRSGGTGRATEADPALLLKEVLRSDSPARQVLPREGKWLNAAEDLLRLRNRTFHYAGGVSEEVLAEVERFRYVASAVPLPCGREFDAVRARLVALERGRTFASSGQVATATDDLALEQARQQELTRTHDADAARIAQLQDDALEAEAQLARNSERTAQLEEAVQDKSARIAELETGLANADATAAELDMLREQVRLAEHERTKLADAAAAADARDAQLRKELKQALADQADLGERIRDADDQVRKLAALVRDAVAPQSRPAQAAPGPTPFPEPGEPWPYAPGPQRWRLSKEHRTLTRTEDKATLASLLGSDRAAQLTERFLTIRPDGGKVMVDSDGDAVTWMDGGWRYLGRLEEAQREEPRTPTPGAVLDELYPTGKKYRMLSDGQIHPVGGGPELAQVIGADRARAVRERIRHVKPSGGRLWVRRSGAIVGIDSARDRVVVVAQVHAHEWYPGVVD